MMIYHLFNFQLDSSPLIDLFSIAVVDEVVVDVVDNDGLLFEETFVRCFCNNNHLLSLIFLRFICGCGIRLLYTSPISRLIDLTSPLIYFYHKIRKDPSSLGVSKLGTHFF